MSTSSFSSSALRAGAAAEAASGSSPCEGRRSVVADDGGVGAAATAAAATATSPQDRAPTMQQRRRLRRWAVATGFGMVLVTSMTTTTTMSDLQKYLVDTRTLVRRRAAGTTTTTTTMTTRGRDDDNDGSVGVTDGNVEDLSSLPSSLLPWLPWERDSMTNGSCHAPSNVPDRCCVGATSAGGGLFVSPECLAKGTEPYDRVKARAADFLRQHPVPPPGRRRFLMSSSSSSSSRARSAFPAADQCDTCQIVSHLLSNNYTLTFQGDSVMGQAFAGWECDLLRRGYRVTSTTTEHPHIEGLGWRYGLSKTHTLRIAAPFDGRRDDHQHRATVTFRAMYRPIHDMQEVATIATQSDIFVFDHGLHYGPQDVDSMKEFENSTVALLSTVRDSARTKLVVWKETTPQHFNTSGGHWADIGYDCVPITEGHEGVHRAIVEKAAAQAGYARVVNATDLTNDVGGPHGLRGGGGGKHSAPSDLVVLPYRDFLIPFYDLHGDECTHFCSSAYMYVPLWRSLRLALDAYFVS